MNDIVERLRNWRTVHLARLHLLMEEAADEIERLRGDAEIARLRLNAAQCLSRTGSDLRQTSDNASESIDQARKLPERERLTAEEREAIKVCESDYSDNDMDAACWKIAATLRSLLERLG